MPPQAAAPPPPRHRKPCRKLRVAVGKLWHEANSFNAVDTEQAALYAETAYSHVKLGTACLPVCATQRCAAPLAVGLACSNGCGRVAVQWQCGCSRPGGVGGGAAGQTN